MSFSLQILLLILLYISSYSYANHVIVFAPPFSGHMNLVLPLANELQKRGHLVEFALFDDTLHYIKEYNFSTISLGTQSPINKTKGEELLFQRTQNPFDFSLMTRAVKEVILTEYGPVFTALNSTFTTKKPDLVVATYSSFSVIDLAKIYDINLVVITPTTERISHHLPPAPYLPVPHLGRLFVEYQSIYEQIENFVMAYVITAKLIPTYLAMRDERAKYGVIFEVEYKGVLIMPSVWGLEIARPIPPNLFMVGNMWPLEDPNEAWETDTAKWLSESEKPVLYVALGSQQTLHESQLGEFYGGLHFVAQKLGIRILWVLPKHQKQREQIIAQNDDQTNLRIESWGDQRRTLSHKNVFCFFSHGGQNSVSESLARGKPLIVMPFVGDQFSNAAQVVYSRSGIKLPFNELSKDALFSAVQHIKENKENYTKSAEKIAQLMKDAGGVKKAADLAESVLKMGVNHLLPPKDNTKIWIKIIPHIFISILLIFVFKIMKIIITKFVQVVLRRSQTKIKDE